MSWSIWQQMYKQYTVAGARIMIIPEQITSTAVTENAYCGVYLSEDINPAYLDRHKYIESTSTRSRGTWRMLNNQRNQVPSVKSFYSAKKWWNLQSIKDNNNLYADTNNMPSPSEQCYFVLWYQNSDGNTSTAQFQVIIDFYVLFKEPKNID